MSRVVRSKVPRRVCVSGLVVVVYFPPVCVVHIYIVSKVAKATSCQRAAARKTMIIVDACRSQGGSQQQQDHHLNAVIILLSSSSSSSHKQRRPSRTIIRTTNIQTITAGTTLFANSNININKAFGRRRNWIYSRRASSLLLPLSSTSSSLLVDRRKSSW